MSLDASPHTDRQFAVARDGNTFGPYTEPELRDHIATGSVLPTDIARTAAMDEWLPIATLFPAPAATETLPGGLPRAFPNAPNLNWLIVAVLEVLTLNCFSMLWNIVQSIWLRRVQPRSTAVWYYVALAVLFAIKAPQAYSTMMFNLGLGLPTVQPFGRTLFVATLSLAIISRIVMRRELLVHFNREEPIGLSLSWALSVMFGGIYFQYHFNRINAMKRHLSTL